MLSMIRRWRAYDERIEGVMYDYRTMNERDDLRLVVNSYDAMLKIVDESGEIVLSVPADQTIESIGDDGVTTFGLSKMFVFKPDDREHFASAVKNPRIIESSHLDSDTFYMYDQSADVYTVHSCDVSISYEASTNLLTVFAKNGNVIVCQKIPPEHITIDRFHRSVIWTYILDVDGDPSHSLTWLWGFRFVSAQAYQRFILSLMSVDAQRGETMYHSSSDCDYDEIMSDRRIDGADISLSKDDVHAYMYSDDELFSIDHRNDIVRVCDFPSKPRQIMLFDDERKIVSMGASPNGSLLNNGSPSGNGSLLNNVSLVDIDKSSVVKEWSVDRPISKISHTSKFAQNYPEAVFNALNSLGVMTFDTRTKNGVVSSSMYGAHSRPQLSCIATTDSGDVAIGSKSGEVRLYESGSFSTPDRAPRAKTMYSGFGDPIVCIDVTRDGSYILCTCKTYLIVMKSTIDGVSGFKMSLGEKRIAPMRLEMSAADNSRMQPSFTKAKFDSSSGSKIVTSTGSKVIIWFGLHDGSWIYTIHDIGSQVIDQDFLFETCKPIVATSNTLIV